MHGNAWFQYLKDCEYVPKNAWYSLSLMHRKNFPTTSATLMLKKGICLHCLATMDKHWQAHTINQHKPPVD
jgi:hypothetical protein